MPYSVPRRSTRLSTYAESSGSNVGDLPTTLETSTPSRILNTLAENVINLSDNIQPSRKTQKPQQSPLRERITLSPSISGLPTPPHSHSNDVQLNRQSARSNSIKTPSIHDSNLLKTPPRSHKRVMDSPGLQREVFGSTSKRRALQEVPSRIIYSAPRSQTQSPSQSRKSPVKSRTSMLLRQALTSNLCEYDDDDDDDDNDDEAHTRDRIVLLPTKRTREMTRSRLLRNASNASTSFQSDLPETSQRILFENELRLKERQEQQVAEGVADETNMQDDTGLLFNNYDTMQVEEQADRIPEESREEESLEAHPHNATSQSIHTSPLVNLPPSRRDGDSSPFQSRLLFSSPPAHPLTPMDAVSSPSKNSREKMPPMESTPFTLGKKKVSGRRSTPYPDRERKVRASLAALNSPHKAQRIRIEGEQPIRVQVTSHLSSPPMLIPATRPVLPSSVPERDFSTILAVEQDDDSDDDDLSHFTVEASRLKVDLTPRKRVDDLLDRVRSSQLHRLSNVQRIEVQREVDESEEILADDFIYETVVAEEAPSEQQEISPMSTRSSSPVLMDVCYNPEGDMNLDWAEVQKRKQLMKRRPTSSPNALQQRRDEGAYMHPVSNDLPEEQEAEQFIKEDQEVEESAEEEEMDEEEYSDDMKVEVDAEEEGSLQRDDTSEGSEGEQVFEEERILQEMEDDQNMEDDDEGFEVGLEVSEEEEEVSLNDAESEQSYDEEEEFGQDEEVEEESSLEERDDVQASDAEEISEDAEEDGVTHEEHDHLEITRQRSVSPLEANTHATPSLVTKADRELSRLNHTDSTFMDNEGNTTLWDAFKERVRMLTARSSMVEVCSLDREAAARAAAILKLYHRYVQHGMLDTEIEDEVVESSMHRSLVQEASTIRGDTLRKQVARRMLLSQDQSQIDKTLDQFLLEQEEDILRSISGHRSPHPSPSLTTLPSLASPKTPLLPGAFPKLLKTGKKGDVRSSKLHLTIEEIVAKVHARCSPSEVKLGNFGRESWRALDDLMRAEIVVMANDLLTSSGMTKGEALLAAALNLVHESLAEAFLDAYNIPHSGQSDTKEWTKAKIQRRIAALLRSFLSFLQEKYSELEIDAEMLAADLTMSKTDKLSSKEAVDESGLAEASLQVPFRMVTQSTPAPLHQQHALHRDSIISPSFGRSRSGTLNIYPRLPSPTPTVKAKQAHSGSGPAQRQETTNTGDTSEGLMSLASKSISYVYASLGWKKTREEDDQSEDKSKGNVPLSSQDLGSKTADHRPIRSLPRPGLHSSSNLLGHTSSYLDQSQSQVKYRSGSSQLTSSGISSSVDPTALVFLSPHTHSLAKSKMLQLKQSREARNWRSPHSRSRSQPRFEVRGV